MAEPLLLTGGLVIDPSQNLEAVRDVLLRDGRVEALAPGLSRKLELRGVPTFDARGKWVLPGLIDMHAHLREPGGEGDETIGTGTRAAARGGFTTVLAMANTDPPVDNPPLVRFLQAKAASEGAVNVLFAGAATIGQKGQRLTEIGRLAAAGVPALSDDGRPIMDAEVMRRALEHARDAAIPLIAHCEDRALSHSGCMNEGAAATSKGLRGMPSAAETVMALRDIALAELTGAKLHIAHVSCAAAVEAVRRAKKSAAVTCEAAPHHWTLTDSDIPAWNADFKMNPPLRGGADRAAVLEGLADGTIDAIATDHAPHGPGKKALGLELAPFGVIGLETALGLALTRLVGAKVLNRRQLVERLSAAPARILGLARKGSLKPGMDADVTIVDPDKRWTVSPPFASKSRNCPFIGMSLKGLAHATIVGGRVVHAV